MDEEKDEQIEMQDDSGDKNYFTMIPNYILNHSTATAQALYFQLKKLAGEKGIAFPSRNYLMEKLGVSKPTLLNEFKYLLDKGWVKRVEDKTVITAGGPQQIKAYKIVDIWKLNIDHYEELYKGGKKENPPLDKGVKNNTQGGKETYQKGVKNTTPNNIHINNNQLIRKDILPSVLDKDNTMRAVTGEKMSEYILDHNYYKNKKI